MKKSRRKLQSCTNQIGKGDGAPNFELVRPPDCKVIRIGKRVQPDISKARQQVNIDRPAYNKTDKQCRTRTTITARLPDG